MGDFKPSEPSPWGDKWEPQEPPRGFAEKVIAATRAESRPESQLRGKRRSIAVRAGTALLLAGSLAAGALLFIPRNHPADQGDAIAKGERTEVRVAGGRAIAVLEPGAHVSWSGDDVKQTSGDVFYRVEPHPGLPSAFRVHTAAGDVTVKGTCFRVQLSDSEETTMNGRDVKAGVIGAGLTAMALIGVYEGKVAASNARGSVELSAGQSATLNASGAHKNGDLASGGKAFAAASAVQAQSSDDDPLMQANRNLVDTVKQYKDRLAANEADKAKIESQLKEAQQKLATQENDGAAPKSEFDLSQDDWKQLAEDGTIKARYPCGGRGGQPWTVSPDTLTDLGLSPDDGQVLQAAYQQSIQRQTDVLMPACAQLVGSADLAARLGPSVCSSVVDHSVQGDQHRQDVTTVAQIRAGILPIPGPNDSIDPYEKLLLSQTGELKSFESDLAKSLGPEEAHRIAYSESLGSCNSITTDNDKKGGANLSPGGPGLHLRR